MNEGKRKSRAELQLHKATFKVISSQRLWLALYEGKLSRSNSQIGFFSVDMINSTLRNLLSSSFLILDIWKKKEKAFATFSIEFSSRKTQVPKKWKYVSHLFFKCTLCWPKIIIGVSLNHWKLEHTHSIANFKITLDSFFCCKVSVITKDFLKTLHWKDPRILCRENITVTYGQCLLWH